MADFEQPLKLCRLLVENSLGLMCIHDLDGVLLAINPAVAQSLGYRLEDGLGRNLQDFLAPAVRHLFDAYLERIRTHPTDSGLMRLQAKDGSERIWFYRNARYEEPGAPPRVLGHALDITERVLAECALKESQRELAQARDELAVRVAERTAELQQANERLRAEIAERERMEEQLLQARKMESLSVLAGGIAHDFNNVVTILHGNLTLAKKYIQPGDRLFEILRQLDIAGQRLVSLTTALMTFAKGGAPIRRTVSVGKLLEDTVELVRAGSGCAFDVNIPEDLWPAECDAGQLAQVFQNVLMNAREAMLDTGVIEVRAGNVLSNEGAQPPGPGRYVRMSVRDHGCGILPENLPKIFDPYFSTKRAGGGLGLASAYSIIARHKGQITVESIPGAGALFHILLPAVEKVVDVQPPVEEQPERGLGRVLVMDDQDPIRRLLAQMLGSLGYEVECTREGAEAIDAYERAIASGRRFDAVLLDLSIPGGMGGKEAAYRLRQIDPLAKIIVSSGYSEDPILSEFLKYGFDDVIPKPWTLTRLSQVINHVIGTGRTQTRS